jgi:hypothetical protein
MDKRKNKRFTAPLRVKLNSGSLIALGMLCDVSENGLFVKSNRDFTMDAAISIEIFMPDNVNSLLKGTVKRKIELSEPYRKHGFGIEIIEKDSLYLHFIRFLLDRGKDLRKLVFSEQESRHRKIKSELQERCRLFDVVAFFIGEQSKQDQLLGKVWFEAKMKNSTNYTFKAPIVTSMTITNTNNHHIQNDQSNSFPEVGVVMISSINDVSWKPDETILFTGEISSVR